MLRLGEAAKPRIAKGKCIVQILADGRMACLCGGRLPCCLSAPDTGPVQN
ncbi:hypothetical protein [Delftia tsuruhatensis]|nr:hypothetical protein [Delftia tsuruhatensis]CAC9693914.1 Uncharacterised protein [Delftia tsuruhatensis]